MKRRTFLRDSGMYAMGIISIGNIRFEGDRFVGDSPTTTDILGPYYRPGSPVRSDLVPAGSKGRILHLTGKVYDVVSKKPLTGVKIEAWQCDESMNYDNSSDEYLFRGQQVTGKDGKYNFRTIIPAPYKVEEGWRPAHIHLRVSSSLHQDLITQVYFKGDPHLQGDDSSKHSESTSRILDIRKRKDGEDEVIFDIVMSEQLKADESVYRRICGLYKTERGMIEFVREDDMLMLKVNGQIMEGLQYKGNNTFTGGLGFNTAVFQVMQDKSIKVKLTMWDIPGNEKFAEIHEGVKVLKYG